jgi:hypothetical protein
MNHTLRYSDFRSVNDMGTWSKSCLTAPFYGQFNPDQIYSPEASNMLVAVVSAPLKGTMNMRVTNGGNSRLVCDECLILCC